MKITYYGHSCFTLEVKGKVVLFDPFISPNELASKIDINKIHADYILISHGHQDHIADAVSIAQRTGAKVISNWEIISWLGNQGLENTHPMNIGGHWFFDFGKVKCVNAVHSSSLPDGSYGGNPMGFLLETDEGNVYYAGDTALTLDMKLIGDYKRIDLAFLPIGNNFTMGIDNAVLASDFIRCEKIIGMHYDTFDYIKIDHDEAFGKFAAAGKELVLLQIAQSITL
ncbi:MAG: metal-dependent hydrolase [Bacteroidetes bacterium]|jgi:L-ascorbate metabolism protein UlaG (beta-lactamase superfamily)|nr:metal-dependent hydrolase [Bacteroidota bacterium]